MQEVFLFKERLEYRVSIFAGRNIDAIGPLRITGRFAYNFLDTEKGFSLLSWVIILKN